MPSARATATRELLIDATEALLREGGLAAVTTQNVARRAGVAEGTIYRHFESRDELIVRALRERLRGDFATIDARGVPEAMTAVIALYATAAPALAMLAADPSLSARAAAALREDGRGPRELIASLAKRLRITPAAATLVVGASFYRSLMRYLFGDEPTELNDEQFSAALGEMLARLS